MIVLFRTHIPMTQIDLFIGLNLPANIILVMDTSLNLSHLSKHCLPRIRSLYRDILSFFLAFFPTRTINFPTEAHFEWRSYSIWPPAWPFSLAMTASEGVNTLASTSHPFAMLDNMLTVSGGFFSLVLLILDFIAIFEILNSTRTTTNKLLWALFVFFFPVLGLLCYL